MKTAHLIAVGLLAALAFGACGKKGDLEPPEKDNIASTQTLAVED